MTFNTDLSPTIMNDVSYLEAGIHENVILSKVTANKSQNGNSFIEFKFTDPTGATLTHTEWEPTRRTEDTEQSFQARIDNLMRRLLQIIRIYTSENYKVTSFEEMTKWIEDKLSNAAEIPVRIKAVYSWSETKKRDYVQLPKYSRYVFIEKMTVSKANSKIRQLQIDKFDRTYVPDVEINNPNQFGAPTLGNSQDDDMPF